MTDQPMNESPDSTSQDLDGLVSLEGEPPDSLDEAEAVREARQFPELTHIYFRRLQDNRSSVVGAYVVDNRVKKLSEADLAQLHRQLWLHGVAPLLYVEWESSVDVLSCARGPDFWEGGLIYQRAARIDHLLTELRSLGDGTFWENPAHAPLADHDQGSHRRLIKAIEDADAALDGANHPVLRRLLLLMVLIKYLEDREVFPSGWFQEFHPGASSFHDVLLSKDDRAVRKLLEALENRFNGDVFVLPEQTEQLTSDSLAEFANLVDGFTIKRQIYLWEQYSFRHLPVEVISHLYQRFAHQGQGAYYTPPFLAALMLDYAMPYSSLTGKERVLDPSCGSGIFLVGAFRRLVAVWRSQNPQDPSVANLNAIMRQSIHGVDLDGGALDLAAFSLALAVCDALKPDIIWQQLRFERLRGSNLIEGDYFSEENRSMTDFDVVLGNPPFQSSLSEEGTTLSKKFVGKQKIPDKQSAYLFLHSAMDALRLHGRLCLLQPAGFLYNLRTAKFRQRFFRENQAETVLDFTSVRSLFDGADPKTVAVLACKTAPQQQSAIVHLTFRRTFSAYEKLFFELDHYDCHLVPQREAESATPLWRANLLGGGRLGAMVKRLKTLRNLKTFVKKEDWDYGEGFIAGDTDKSKSTSTTQANNARSQSMMMLGQGEFLFEGVGSEITGINSCRDDMTVKTQANNSLDDPTGTKKKSERRPALFLTGKDYLPTRALTDEGIDEEKIEKLNETLFLSAHTEKRYTAPMVLIRENESLPMAFRKSGFLSFRDKIIGISAPSNEAVKIKDFYGLLKQRRNFYRFYCSVAGTQSLVGKATAILKQDVDAFPWPEDPSDLDMSLWEQAMVEDVTAYMIEYVRLGQNSRLLQDEATTDHIKNMEKCSCICWVRFTVICINKSQSF